VIAKQVAIEVHDLGKHYGNAFALHQLNLTVETGELLVVLGESGSGKSTLLKLIAGLEKLDNGCILFNGRDQARVPPHRRDVAMVFQDGNGYDHLTVRQNLDFVTKHSGMAIQASNWIDSLQLGTLLHQNLSQLSGGERQRVAIARAMLSGKEIVLLDEPLTYLNQTMREQIRNLILDAHHQTGKTFVYVTHDSDEAMFLANRIALLSDGRIQQIGLPREVYGKPNDRSIARLLGQPSVCVLNFPETWLTQSDTQDGVAVDAKQRKIECGVRPQDWRIHRVEIESKEASTNQPLQLSLRGKEIWIKGEIRNCRWMGNAWLIEVDSTPRFWIACHSPANESVEPMLRAVEKRTDTRQPGKTIGSLEASVSIAAILPFSMRDDQAKRNS